MVMNSVLIRYKKNSGDYLKGAEFYVSTAADAKKLHPDAEIVRYEDGRDYAEPKAAAKADDDKPAKAEAKA